MKNNLVAPAGIVSFIDTKPNYNITFNNETGIIGTLDFNGPEMIFTGKAEESAKVFFNWIAESFTGRFESKLKWTSDLPTQEGWYWWKCVTEPKPFLIKVAEFNGRFCDESDDGQLSSLPAYGEWYGPIEPPEYTEKEN